MKKIIAVFGIIACMSISVAASELTYTEVFDYSKGILKVDGHITNPDAIVTVNIPKKGETPDTLAAAGETAGNLIIHSNDTISDKDGNFTFQIEFDQTAEEGDYTVYVGSPSFTSVKTIPVYFTKATNYQTIISQLKGATTEFNTLISNNASKIGLDGDIYNAVSNKTAVYDMIYKSKTLLSETDSMKNTKIFESAIAAQAIKEGITLPDDWINNVYLEDSNIVELYETYVVSHKSDFLTVMNKSFQTVGDFEKNIFNATVLTLVKYPNGAGNIKTVFERYSTALGANTVNADMQDYTYISGSTYTDISKCIEAFNNKVSEPSYPTGGGNGGGGGVSMVVSGGISIPQELTIKFEDLNSVPWAYQAISTLYTKGIINGKSETEYYPNDTITREEFVKLLVCMAGMDNEDYSNNIFSDAGDNAWYTKYVNIAYNNNICNGIDTGVFGVGKEITREDMCVMAHNLLKILGKDYQGNEMPFDDADKFYEYSKPAVQALSAVGIVNGVGNNKFNPKGNATRAQAAVIIYNMLEKLEG